MGGEGNHLMADTSNSDCMKSQGMELLDFVEFGRVMGRGEGRGENFYTFIGSKLVGGGGEPDSDH